MKIFGSGGGSFHLCRERGNLKSEANRGTEKELGVGGNAGIKTSKKKEYRFHGAKKRKRTACLKRHTIATNKDLKKKTIIIKFTRQGRGWYT